MKNLIYFTLFGNKDYLNLVNLLAISFKLFGNCKENIDFMVITSNDFVSEINTIFNKLSFEIDFFIIDHGHDFLFLLSSRVLIFEYEKINKYNKILYIDTDILITNDIYKMFDFSLENKLYTLMEGVIGDIYHGCEFFDFNIYDKNISGFTTGILLFNNCIEIKKLFQIILNDIKDNIENNKIKPVAFDQAFFNYHAITKNLSNNIELTNLCINNPNDYIFLNHTISHFPGGVGNYKDKIERIQRYLLYLYDYYPFKSDYDNFYLNKSFEWKHDCINTNGIIQFGENNIFISNWGNGVYEIINCNTIKYHLCDHVHILKFNDQRNNFISIRRGDCHISKGILYK